ncbi:hypothetical protein EJB05_05496, partial [Eragrostis curvula]
MWTLFMQLTNDKVPSDNEVPPSSEYVSPSDDKVPSSDDDVPSYYGASSEEAEEQEQEQENEEKEQEDEEQDLPPSAFTEEPDWRGIDEDSEMVCYHGLPLRRKMKHGQGDERASYGGRSRKREEQCEPGERAYRKKGSCSSRKRAAAWACSEVEDEMSESDFFGDIMWDIGLREKRIEVIKRKMKATADDQGRNTRMKDSGELGDEAMRMDELHHEEEESNLYALQRLKRVEANEEIFRNLGLPGTLNGDSRNKASQVPNKGRGQKSSTPKATSPVTGGRGSKRVLAPSQEVPRLTRQRARELSTANPVEGTQEDSTQNYSKGHRKIGKDLERINKEMDKKLAIHISEGKKRPEVPLQAAKLAIEGGIVLRRHIPVLPHWNMYRDEREREHLVNYINKVSVQFSMDTTSKPVISACADMMKCGQRQMRYKLKKKFFNNIPANDVVVKSPVPSMNDDQWEALVKLWSSPQHKKTCLANQQNREKVQMNQRTGSRCYVAQAHALRDKFNEEPTPVELFTEFHSSQKTGSISETVQKAIDHMEEIMEESVQREGPPSPSRAVREVVQASTFLEVAGLQPKKRNRGSVSSRLEALMAELQREKAESRQVEQIVEQQRRETDALHKQAQDARDSNRILDAQLEDLRNESARKATLMASLISKFQGEGQ